MGIAGLAIAVVMVLMLQVLMLQRQQGLDKLNAERAEELKRYQSLRQAVAHAEDPSTVYVRARRELGMVRAPDVVYVTPETIPTKEPFERSLPNASSNAETSAPASPTADPDTADGAAATTGEGHGG